MNLVETLCKARMILEDPGDVTSHPKESLTPKDIRVLLDLIIEAQRITDVVSSLTTDPSLFGD